MDEIIKIQILLLAYVFSFMFKVKVTVKVKVRRNSKYDFFKVITLELFLYICYHPYSLQFKLYILVVIFFTYG